MANKAWVTLATNDTYALGALVLAHSLKKVNTSCKLVVLITSNVTFAMRGILQSIYDEVKEVNILDSGDADNLRLLARPELGITFTKLHSWKLTQYEKCVFLDADTLVLQNCDELFEREELSAAPDVGWPDCFNSGVFVFKPSEETFKALYEFAIAHGSFDGGDQGLLNMFFNTWATSDSSKRLPFLYNLSSAAIYSYLPAFKWFGKGVKIIHFISNSKPWLQPFNTGTRTVETAPGSSHLQNFFQYWWDIFCTYVHPQLTPEMTRLLLRSWYTPQITLKTNPSRINPIPYEVCVTYPVVASDEEHFVFTDPWEEFEKNTVKTVETCDINHNKEDSFNESIAHVNHNDFTCDVYENLSEVDNFPCESNVFDGMILNEAPSKNFMVSNEVPHIPVEVHYEPIEVYHNSINDYCNDQNYKTEQINHVPDDIVDEIVQHSCDIPVNNFSSLNSLKNEILREENIFLECKNETNNDAGLANSLSQLKLDEPTPEQIAREDFYRRQNWEFGNIDYMGRDSFDNIWKKISETLNDQEETLPQPYLAICPAKPPEDISNSVDKPDSTPTSVPQLTSDPTPVTPEPVLACPKPSAVDSKPVAPVCVKPSPVPDSSAVPTSESAPLVCPKPAPIPEPSIEPKLTTPETPVCPKPEPIAPVSDVVKAEPPVQPKLEASQLPACPKPQTVSAPEQESQQVFAPKQEPLVSAPKQELQPVSAPKQEPLVSAPKQERQPVSAPKQEPQPTGQTADTQKSETTKKSQSAPEPSKVVPAGSVPAVPQPPSEPSKITETKPAPSQDTKSKQVPKSGGSKKK